MSSNETSDSNDKTVAKRQGSGQGSIPKSIRFPPNLSLSSDNFGDGTSNILAFTIYEYDGTGYMMANSDGKGRNIATEPGKALYFIYLSTPSEQGTSYRQEWTLSDPDLVMAGAVNAAAGIFTNWQGSFDEKYMSAVGSGMKEGFNIAAQALLYNNIQKVLSSMPKTGKVLGQFGGITLSPYQEYLYQNPKTRDPFTFRFKLIPRNPSEIQTINDIIQLFKWASHPSISSFKESSEQLNSILAGIGVDTSTQQGARILSYPNVFGIRYVINESDKGLDDQSIGKDNPWLHKFGPCVCNRVEVGYSQGANNYVSYRSSKDYRFASDEGDAINPEGAPIYYDLAISFQEMIILTKETINAGF